MSDLAFACYDAQFSRWLDKRATRLAALETPSRKIDVAKYVRENFDLHLVTRLNAHGRPAT